MNKKMKKGRGNDGRKPSQRLDKQDRQRPVIAVVHLRSTGRQFVIYRR